MKVYITASETISPQKTFQQTDFPTELVSYKSALSNQKINYKEYFNPLQSRRTNDLIKTNHICALETMRQSLAESPDAIITGSGWGCVHSTEKFLNDLLRTDEGILSPTSFIQSTSNAIGGHIAQHFKCRGYNILYAQKYYSFENAVFDALLRIKEKKETHILVGGFDELTPENYSLKQKISLFKSEPLNNLDIYRSRTIGAIAGEATTYFALSSQKKSKTGSVELKAVYLDLKKENTPSIKLWITDCLKKESLSTDQIDLLLAGFDGDCINNKIYDKIVKSCFKSSTIAYYKNMCGEFDTASSFGTWFGYMSILKNKIPAYSIIIDKNRNINNVLIYNQHHSRYHSLILLSSVK